MTFQCFLGNSKKSAHPKIRERFAICLTNAFCCSVLFSFYVHKIALGNVSLRSVEKEFKNPRDWTVIIVLGVFQVFFRNLLPRPHGGFNKRKTLCSGQTAHMRCIHNWIRTLIPSSVRCPGCRGDYAFPLTPEEEQNLHSFMVECSQVRCTFSNSWNACDKTIQTIQNQILSLSVI